MGSSVEVLDVRREGEATFVTVRTDGTVHPPLAPSSLHFDDGAIMPLDVVISVDDDTAEFRTSATAPVAVTGRVAELRQWWIPDAYDAVVDVGRTWVRERLTDDHEHCMLDWAKIGHGGAGFGWRCNREWVCEPCYDEYFVRDRLGLRRRTH